MAEGPLPPQEAGLCASCRHAKVLGNSRGSLFLRCLREGLDPYPRLPVLACPGFEPGLEDGPPKG